eukprot:1176484-Prorocentrum_minimum.AAC.2
MGEKWEKVGNWTQGEKMGRVSGSSPPQPRGRGRSGIGTECPPTRDRPCAPSGSGSSACDENHDGPIRHRKRGYILTTDQSLNGGEAEKRVSSPRGSIRRPRGSIRRPRGTIIGGTVAQWHSGRYSAVQCERGSAPRTVLVQVIGDSWHAPVLAGEHSSCE